MKRGDIVIVSAPGDYDKPRPAVVIQTNALTDLGAQSVIVCLMSTTSTRSPLFRIPIEPSEANGLEQVSQIMTEKMVTVPKAKITRVIGHLTDEQCVQLNRTLAFVIGLG